MCIASRGETVLWYKKPLPADVRIDFEFKPVSEAGTAQLHFAAKDAGDGISEFLLSYYNRDSEPERSFHICALYKSGYDDPVGIGADPMAGAGDSTWYRICLVKRGKDVYYAVNGLEVLQFHDDGITRGDLLTGGTMGLSQLPGTIALYKNLKVTWI